MASTQLADNYPGERTTTETDRLHDQHDLIVHAFGGLLLCPFDTARSDLRILDIGTADGWWLHCLRRELTDPESATLIGTDIAPYPGAVEEVVIHDFRQDFSKDWQGTFDLVQLRAVLASAAGAANDLVQRALQLLKPGGYIQLVDGAIPSGQIDPNDKPSTQFFKRLGNMLIDQGMDPLKGIHVVEILKDAGGNMIENQSQKSGAMILGKGSQLEQTSWNWLRGMTTVVRNSLVEQGLIGEQEFNRLRLAVFDEAENEGIEFPWYATWATKTSAGVSPT